MHLPHVLIQGDSQLVLKQVEGTYKVNHPDMKVRKDSSDIYLPMLHHLVAHMTDYPPPPPPPLPNIVSGLAQASNGITTAVAKIQIAAHPSCTEWSSR